MQQAKSMNAGGGNGPERMPPVAPDQMNVAHSPAQREPALPRLAAFPL